MNFKQMCSHPLLGANAYSYLRILFKHSISLQVSNLFKLLYILSSTFLISVIGTIEGLFFDKKIAQKKMQQDPVFIIGHWRSGTTFLHYLLTIDEQFGYLNNTQAFMPNTMLVGKKLIQWLVKIHLFPKRPMDNVKITADSAQEEEFALSNFGCGAYLGWYFPEKIRDYFSKYIFFEGCSASEIRQFKKAYKNLILKIAYVNQGKPLILKNPANTGRVEWLLELFPNAKFIYLHRNEYEVYHSTIKLHTKLTEQFSLGKPDGKAIEKMVMDFYPKLLESYETSKKRIPEGNLIEVNYESLTENPLAILETIYEEFNLPAFEKAKPAFEKYIQSQADYEASVYNIKPETIRLIDLFWKANYSKYKAPVTSGNYSN